MKHYVWIVLSSPPSIIKKKRHYFLKLIFDNANQLFTQLLLWKQDE